MPAQVVDQRGALADQAFAVINQQTNLELDTGQPRGRQTVRTLGERRPGNSDRVDAVGLATLTHGAPRAGHHLRGDTNHRLAASDEKPLQTARDMPTVFDGPDPVGVFSPGPEQQLTKPDAPCRRSLVAQHLTGHRANYGDG